MCNLYPGCPTLFKLPGSVGLVLSTAVSPALQQCQARSQLKEPMGFMRGSRGFSFWLSGWVAVKYYEGEACRMGHVLHCSHVKFKRQHTPQGNSSIHPRGLITNYRLLIPRILSAAQVLLLNNRFTKITAYPVVPCGPYNSACFKTNQTPRLTHMQIIPPLVSDGAAAHLVAQVRNLVSLSPSCTYPC